ncbi:MAG: sigma-70 family RNA polymerase sigma factor [Polyangiaceae bacterium]|nr:sigma-70 family RNA polymerase sigma factor [Polyangiaceae bacterium]MBK8936399.1 sigma-70 family RNA polymerase sigma factor [Polyangiaceae bacterium]
MSERAAQSDASLFEAWRAGDASAGEALFERHFDAIYRFFDAKIRADVADLVQRTFLGCVESRERFRGASSFRVFLFAIARHELYQYFRAKRRDAALDFGVSSIADLTPSPSTLARARSERECLQQALRALPLEQQLAVELHYWEGLSGPELAAILEVPEGTVRSRLRRALEGLRDRLAQTPPLGAPPGADLEAWARALATRV